MFSLIHGFKRRGKLGVVVTGIVMLISGTVFARTGYGIRGEALNGRKLLVVNTKGKLSLHKTIELAHLTAQTTHKLNHAVLSAIAPQHTFIGQTIRALKEVHGQHIPIGAQDVHHEAKGSQVGAVFAADVKELGGNFAIIGHSQRREHVLGENKQVIGKARQAVEHNQKIVLCVGETEKQRDKGITNQVVSRQVRAGTKGIPAENVIVAYEPVWSIGGGKEKPTPAQVHEVHSMIKDIFKKTGVNVPVLYGGSLGPKDRAILELDVVDGGLIATAANSPETWIPLLELGAAVAPR